jgi:hypothetical protein
MGNWKSGILPDSDGRASSRSLSSPESTSKMLVGRDKLEAYLPVGGCDSTFVASAPEGRSSPRRFSSGSM